jgi:predicted NACHT family NTPase
VKFRSLQEWKEAVLKEKEQLRQELAKLPYEEKVARLKRMQQVACEVAKIRQQLRQQIDRKKAASLQVAKPVSFNRNKIQLPSH